MTEQDMIDLKEAINLLEQSKLTRIDGSKWTAYKVGDIIRIDIKKK